MLSYQHLYHAGNAADCHKHIILSILLRALYKKETPFCYKETHSGRGLYDLTAPESLKTGEYQQGIQCLWQARNQWPSALHDYRAILSALNPSEEDLRFYPGSPSVAAHMLRAHDSAEFYELHPQEFAALEQNMSGNSQLQLCFADGWEALTTSPAPRENRGLVLIDPSYELKEDYFLMAERLQKINRKWRSAVVAVWYPILHTQAHCGMLEEIAHSGLEKIFISEFIFQDSKKTTGMYGSGMVLMQPPWQSDTTITAGIEFLTEQIGHAHKSFWLVPDRA